MRFGPSMALAATAVAAIIGGAVAEDDARLCPCGIEVSSFPLCDQLEEGVVNPASELCFYEGTAQVSEFNSDECLVSDEGNATCKCRCGFTGDLCDERIEILDYNKILGIVTPLGVLFLASAFLTWRHKFRGGDKDWQINGDRCARPMNDNISPRVLLVYRAVCALVGIYFMFEITIDSKGGALRAFTVWNWFLLTVYFCLGTYLSFKFVQNGPSERQSMTFAEKLFWIIFEVELPSTILICLVVWLVLLPATVSAGFSTDGLVNPFSIFSHALNVGFFLIDLGLNGLYIKLAHFAYVCIWGGLYLGFHNILMLINDAAGDPHCPIYFFLSMDSPIFVGWMFGLLIVFFIFYGIGMAFSLCKEKGYGNKHLVKCADDSKSSGATVAVGDNQA